MPDIIAGRGHRLRGGPTAADLITALRAVLVALCAVLLVRGWLDQAPEVGWWLFGFAAVAWVLDWVDGYVARRTGRVTARGARFDEETDALLILVLALAVAPVAPWAVVLGLARYLFLAGARARPWWRARLPPSRARKVVAATTGGILVGSVLPGMPPTVVQPATVVGALLLLWSFGRDVRWAERHRPAQPS